LKKRRRQFWEKKQKKWKNWGIFVRCHGFMEKKNLYREKLLQSTMFSMKKLQS